MGRRNVKSNIAGARRPPEPERYVLIKEAEGREMMTDEELGKELLRLKVIWFGMLGSLAIYLFIGLQIATSPQASMNESTFAVLKTVLYIITTVLLVITKYIRKHILSGKGQDRQATQSFQHPALQKYATAMIVAWASSESIGIFGLVLFFLGKKPADLYLLIVISAVAMFMYRPRKDEVISLFQKGWEASSTGGEAV